LGAVTFANALCAVLTVSPPNVDAHVRGTKISVSFSFTLCHLVCYTGFNIFNVTLPPLGFAMVENFVTLGYPSYGTFVILGELGTIILLISFILLDFVTVCYPRESTFVTPHFISKRTTGAVEIRVINTI